MNHLLPKPTDAELEILQILWSNTPATVRYVNDQLNTAREVGYTTTLKTMQNMLDKRLLSREIVEKTHLYSPAYSQAATQEVVLRDLADAAFGGSTSSLVLRALGAGETTKEELERIKAMIEQLEASPNPSEGGEKQKG